MLYWALLQSLSAQYDVRDSADYATMIKMLTPSVVNAQSDLSEQALRSQFDLMSTAQAAIIRMGNEAQPESALSACFLTMRYRRPSQRSGSSFNSRDTSLLWITSGRI